MLRSQSVPSTVCTSQGSSGGQSTEQRGGVKNRYNILVVQARIPAVSTPKSGSRFPNCEVGLCFTRSGSPCRTAVAYHSTTAMAPPSDTKSDEDTTGISACMSSVTPTDAGLGGVADRSGHPRAPTLLETVAETIRRAPLGTGIGALLPRRLGQRGSDGDALGHAADSPGRTGSPIAMADLDVALSSFGESLLAEVSRVIAESPAGDAQSTPRCHRLAHTHEGWVQNKARPHRGSPPSFSSSSASLSSSPSSSSSEKEGKEATAIQARLLVL